MPVKLPKVLTAEPENLLPDQAVRKMLSYGCNEWIRKKKWPSLRPVQSKSCSEWLMHADMEAADAVRGMLIVAPTAGGKTEAALLPTLSELERTTPREDPYSGERFIRGLNGEKIPVEGDERVGLLYVAPLKALLNDQYRRASEIAQECQLQITLWHGDAAHGQRNKFLKHPSGMLLTTPESLEGFLARRGEWSERHLLPDTVIIDEFHAMIGTDRGAQLLDLLHRIDGLRILNGLPMMRRMGLSATISEPDRAALAMMGGMDGAIVVDATGKKDDLEIDVIGIAAAEKGSGIDPVPASACMVGKMAGTADKALCFCTSRNSTEQLASGFKDELHAYGLNWDNRVYAHHGLLEKLERERVEEKIREGQGPLICFSTTTLELGIDIGDIDLVIQEGAAPTVGQLRQRIGRSGRQNGVRRLIVMAPVKEISDSDMVSDGRSAELSDLYDAFPVLEAIAEVELMLDGWYEPPSTRSRYPSTLVLETISAICQYGSARPSDLWRVLCSSPGAAFSGVLLDDYMLLCKDLVKAGYLYTDTGNRVADESGDSVFTDPELLLGEEGDKLANSRDIYATFKGEDTWKIMDGQRTVGDVPLDQRSLTLFTAGMIQLALGGKVWVINRSAPMGGCDASNRILYVMRSAGKGVVISGNSGARVKSGIVGSTICRLLTGDLKGYVPGYADGEVLSVLKKARAAAEEFGVNGLGILRAPMEEGISARWTPETQVLMPTALSPIDTADRNGLDLLLAYCGMDTKEADKGVPLWRMREIAIGALDTYKHRENDKYGAIEEDILFGYADGEEPSPDELAEKVISLVEIEMSCEFATEDMVAAEQGRDKFGSVMSEETAKRLYAPDIVSMRDAIEWLEAFVRFCDTVN